MLFPLVCQHKEYYIYGINQLHLVGFCISYDEASWEIN